MAKTLELRRHTANDGDVLTDDGVEAAVRIGGMLAGSYDLIVSSGAQRATQAAAGFLSGLGERVPGGIVVDDGFRSLREERWREIYEQTKDGDVEAFLEADFAFVDEEARRFAEALHRVAAHVRDGGRALIVGHSPMLEAAVWSVTGSSIPALGKGDGVVLRFVDGGFALGE